MSSRRNRDIEVKVVNLGSGLLQDREATEENRERTDCERDITGGRSRIVSERGLGSDNSSTLLF